jgi:hypothetical protein
VKTKDTSSSAKFMQLVPSLPTAEGISHRMGLVLLPLLPFLRAEGVDAN